MQHSNPIKINILPMYAIYPLDSINNEIGYVRRYEILMGRS